MKRVVFLGGDAETIMPVSERLATKGIEVLGFQDAAALDAGVGAACDTVLVVDSGVLAAEEDVLQLLDGVDRQSGGRPSLVCISPSGDIESRLQALRAGAAAFFAKPVVIADLTARLLELSGSAEPESYRILIVDDQPVAALFAAGVLKSAGMQTRIAGEALRVLDALEDFRPDLVLMDLNMPGADGLELTTLIREHDELYDTPVVFLSSELDPDKRMDALRAGGNDFISKPVSPERLVEAVRRGVADFHTRRGRENARYERDWVTGLMSRSSFLRRLDALVARPNGQKAGDGVLMIEIDLSEATARAREPIPVDVLMKRLAEVLQARVLEGECAARYSDRRFAVLAQRESEGALQDLAKSLQQALKSVTDAHTIGVCIGIGRFDPPARDALAIVSRAEKACAQVRDNAGDRVGVYRPLVWEGVVPEREARFVEMVEEALRSESFRLMFQPIVPLKRTRGELYEITLRLSTAKGESVSAFDFYPAAQRRGLVPALDRWVLRHALDRFKREQASHKGLKFFLHQTMETLRVEDWVPWFREQIVRRDLIMNRPILQFQQADLCANRALAAVRLEQLRKLAIDVCLNIVYEDPQLMELIPELGISLVRLPPPTSESLDAVALTDFVARLHRLGVKVIIARLENPQTLARISACGVDFIQGNFLQMPTSDLGFDFSESALF